jgi:hypothetical protein
LTYVAGRAFVAGSTTELTTVGPVLVASDPSNLTGTPVSMSVIFPPTDGDTWTYYLNYDAGTLSISPEQVAPTALLSARLSSTSTGSSGGTGSSTPVNKSKYIRVNRANMQQYRYLFNR